MASASRSRRGTSSASGAPRLPRGSQRRSPARGGGRAGSALALCALAARQGRKTIPELHVSQLSHAVPRRQVS